MSGRIRLVASDLDGTLLLNGAQSLQPGTCELIHRLTRKGICFLAASGAAVCQSAKAVCSCQDEIAYMCENGCLSFFRER